MKLPHTSLTALHSYRGSGVGERRLARGHLAVGADAMRMALLTLDSPTDVSRRAKLARVATARQLIIEAVTSLARARVYLPRVRSYTVDVVTHGERDPDLELKRLRGLVATLLWLNHEFLPAQHAAEPLAPEDEAQLAEVVRDLAIHAKLDRAMRYKWLVAGALIGMLAPVVGVALYAVAAASGAMGAVELARSGPLIHLSAA